MPTVVFTDAERAAIDALRSLIRRVYTSPSPPVRAARVLAARAAFGAHEALLAALAEREIAANLHPSSTHLARFTRTLPDPPEPDAPQAAEADPPVDPPNGPYSLRFVRAFSDPFRDVALAFDLSGPPAGRLTLFGAWGLNGRLNLDEAVLHRDGPAWTWTAPQGSLTIRGQGHFEPAEILASPAQPPTDPPPPLLAAAMRGLRAFGLGEGVASGAGGARRIGAYARLLEPILVQLPGTRPAWLPAAPAGPPEGDAWAAAGAIAALVDAGEDLWALPTDPLGFGASLPDLLDETHADHGWVPAAAWTALGACLAAGVAPPAGLLAYAEARDPDEAPGHRLAAAARLRAHAPALGRLAATLHAWGWLDAHDAVDVFQACAEPDFRLARLLELLDQARAPARWLARSITWDYELEEGEPGTLVIEGRSSGYTVDVQIVLHGPVFADLPTSWSHPRFSVSGADPTLDPWGITLDIEVEAGGRDARRARVVASGLSVDGPGAPAGRRGQPTEPAPDAAWVAAFGPPGWLNAPEADFGFAPGPADAWVMGGPAPEGCEGTRFVSLVRLSVIGVDASDRRAEALCREAVAAREDRLVGADEAETAQLKREIAALAVGEPDAAWRAEAWAEAARFVVLRAFEAEPRPIRIDADAIGGSRVIADPIGRAAWSEAERVAALAADYLREHRAGERRGPSMAAMLPDPTDRARLAEAGRILGAAWPALTRLAEALTRRGALDAEAAERLFLGDLPGVTRSG